MPMLALTVNFSPSISQTSAMLLTILAARASALEFVLDFQHQEEELVTATAAYRVATSHDDLQTLRNLLQYPVAGFMPVRIVDALELIKVDKHNRQAPIVALRLRQAVAQPVFEELQVRQAGHCIMESVMTRCALPHSAFGQRSIAIREPVLQLLAFVNFLRQGVTDVNELGGGLLSLPHDRFTLNKRELDFRERHAIDDFVLQDGVDGGQGGCGLLHFFVHLRAFIQCAEQRRSLVRSPCGGLLVV